SGAFRRQFASLTNFGSGLMRANSADGGSQLGRCAGPVNDLGRAQAADPTPAVVYASLVTSCRQSDAETAIWRPAGVAFLVEREGSVGTKKRPISRRVS